MGFHEDTSPYLVWVADWMYFPWEPTKNGCGLPCHRGQLQNDIGLALAPSHAVSSIPPLTFPASEVLGLGIAGVSRTAVQCVNHNFLCSAKGESYDYLNHLAAGYYP